MQVSVHEWQGDPVQSRVAAWAADLEQLLLHSPARVAIWNADYTNRMANQAYADLFGLSAQALRGRHLHEVMPPEVLALSLGPIQAALGGERQQFERSRVTPDGRELVERVSYVPDTRSEPPGLLVFIEDVSELRGLTREARQLAERFQSLYERTPAMLHSMDRDGRLISVSDTWLQTLGYERHEVLGRLSTDFLTEASQAKARDFVIPAFFETGEVHDIDYQFACRNGALVDVLMSAVCERDESGAFVRSLAVSTNVSQQTRLRSELRAQHELMRVTMESIADAVMTTDCQGHIEWMNPVAVQLTGWPLAEALGRPIDEVFHLIHEETHARVESPVVRALCHGTATTLPEFTTLVCRDGSLRGIDDSAAPIRGPDGAVRGAVLVFHDVSEQRRLSAEVSYRATRDSLTGLINRAEFDLRLNRAFSSARQSVREHALMYIDLDQFKLVNDACGHAAGDTLLKDVAQLLLHVVRSRDTLARVGGDEFAILMEDCTAPQARRVAQAICDQLEIYRFLYEGHRFRIGASIGLVPLDARWPSVDAVMQAADTACYTAKEGGRNRVHEWFDSDELIHARHDDMQWASRLSQALDEGRLVLYAQRIEKMVAPAEAGLHLEILLRLVDDAGQVVPPGAFIPAAERYNQITRLDRWVLQNALNWLMRQADGVAMVSVNLSGHSMVDRKFQDFALGKIRDLGPLAGKLCLEVTETAAINNLNAGKAFLSAVRQLGALVALDDFGAGASFFGYLKHLPVDFLKIDGQFVKEILSCPLDRAAVACFQEVASLCGISTIAEFVESQAVLDELSVIGVHYAQGYHLHRPEPLTAFEAALPAAPSALLRAAREAGHQPA